MLGLVCMGGCVCVYGRMFVYVPLRPVVSICTAQCSLHVLYSGHYMCRIVVTICTPHSGHYMYPTVVTIFTFNGHYMYRQFNIQQFYVLPTQLYLCVLCGSI